MTVPLLFHKVSLNEDEDEEPLNPVERDGQAEDNSSSGEEWDDSDTDINGLQKNATHVEFHQSQTAKSILFLGQLLLFLFSRLPSV